MSAKSMKFIHFYNKTDLPVMIDSWMDESWVEESCCLQTIRVGPREKRLIHSSVGEWILHTMFDNEQDKKLWENKGYNKYNNIGKFRSRPCAQGNYSWMEYDEPFLCIYSELDGKEEGEINGVITFYCKKEKTD